MEEMHKKADFYKKKRGKKVRCRLCSHFCLIEEGKTGICRVRKNVGGELHSLVYGRSVAMNIDPVEKKPLYHFMPGTSTFSLGTLGCNFHCLNCHNYQISQAEIDTDVEITSPREIVEMAKSSGCSSISYTYNEPTVFTEYALDTMKLAREDGLANVWVSNGYMSEEALNRVIPYLDAINVDLKSMDDNIYQTVCGGRLRPILNNLKKIKKAGVHLEITTLMIPELTDDKQMLKKIAKFIAGKLGKETPWHISRFSPEISWKLKDTSSTNEWKMETAHKLGKNAGLKFVYSPFIEEDTRCPKCGEVNVKRFRFDAERLDKDGKCRQCGQGLNIK